MGQVILVGIAVFLITLSIQGLAAIGLIRIILPRVLVRLPKSRFWGATLVLEITLMVLLVAALAQIGVWALAFVLFGQFADLGTAVYHSAVNFATLGYGDIVMPQPWRLLGPMEAVNGVLMLGLSGSLLNTTFLRLGSAMRKQSPDAGSDPESE